VSLWLPISILPIDDATGSEAGDTPLEHARGHVLLVDDEDVVRMSTAGMLEDMGYAVAEAQSAEQALALLESGMQPDLLVTDHLMPGMSGADLARRVRDLRPSLPVLIVSGYADADGIAPDLPRLAKPFRAAELAASLTAIRAAAAA
jgi:CheY-like chemotaxis protein